MKMPKPNSSKFAIFLEYENPCSFVRFSFRATLFFSPGLCRHRPGHSLGNKIKLQEMKNEKN